MKVSPFNETTQKDPVVIGSSGPKETNWALSELWETQEYQDKVFINGSALVVFYTMPNFIGHTLQ